MTKIINEVTDKSCALFEVKPGTCFSFIGKEEDNLYLAVADYQYIQLGDKYQVYNMTQCEKTPFLRVLPHDLTITAF